MYSLLSITEPPYTVGFFPLICHLYLYIVVIQEIFLRIKLTSETPIKDFANIFLHVCVYSRLLNNICRWNLCSKSHVKLKHNDYCLLKTKVSCGSF